MTSDDTLIFELSTHWLNEFDDSNLEESNSWAKSMVDDINKNLEEMGENPHEYSPDKKRNLAFDMIKTMDAMTIAFSEKYDLQKD